MRQVCFLSMDDMSGYVADDDLAIRPLGDLGWSVRTLSWRDPAVDWSDMDAVVIRTTWDYQNDPDAFLRVLGAINDSPAVLLNPLDIVRWNLNKSYLREIERRGCPIVPTIWDPVYSERNFAEWQAEFDTEELIVKPLVSATAQHTYRLRRFDPALADVLSTRDLMVQPFMPAIVTEGEYSLFYFGGEFTHAINKIPKPADFRVQEEHGGIITSVSPDDALLTAGKRAMDLIGECLLYARVDLVRDARDEFVLMELELIEPALYFRMDERSPRFFAEQFDRMMNEL